jgi:hypothetical protein
VTVRLGGSSERSTLLSVGEVSELTPQLAAQLAATFSTRVLDLADLPPDRANDLRDSCEVDLDSGGSPLRLTCTITGSTYEREWDGSEQAALSLAEEAAEGTAYLVSRTPHYAWLRSAR